MCVCQVLNNYLCVCQVLNNYLGIGIDAKVALEVHQIRENFPNWFQSQVTGRPALGGCMHLVW